VKLKFLSSRHDNIVGRKNVIDIGYDGRTVQKTACSITNNTQDSLEDIDDSIALMANS
jgi:hypothetical protein